MKNQILDEPIHNSFSDLLEKGETIIWEESPKLNLSYFNQILKKPSRHLFEIILAILFLTVYLITFIGPMGGTIFFFSLVIIQHFWVNYKNSTKKKTRYAISQKRIFFYFESQTKTIHSIDFTELRNFQIIQNKYDLKTNTFFLIVKDPTTITFSTYNFKNNELRHQPTLELIENHKSVAQLIRQGIQQNN